jgi:beta-glucanase (GH16 family)
MRALRLYPTLALALLIASCGGGGSDESDPSTAAPDGYSLVWSDEFDVDGLPDPTRWDHDTDRNKLGWYNNEQQYYARDRADNAVVSDGRLVITARKEDLSAMPDWGGQAYSSARLITRGKATWTYGHVEVRARMPCAKGTWSAAWMLAETGRWPDDGEIDIVEHVGTAPDRIFSTLHSSRSAALPPPYSIRLESACTAFHTYHLTWTPDSITMGVDGAVHYRALRNDLDRTAWPFTGPQYLLLNVAIGGSLGGAIDDLAFPASMEVEYVRVYQKSATVPVPVPEPVVVVPPAPVPEEPQSGA